MPKVEVSCGVVADNDSYRHSATSSTTATKTPPSTPLIACTCADFLTAATALGYEVLIQATPLDGEAGWSFVGDDVCGCARFVRPDRLPAIGRRLSRVRAAAIGA